jgi:hypothetical protein
MDKELHANCHKGQSCCGIKIATNLQELRKCPYTENTQFLPRNLVLTPHILQLKFYGGSKSSRHYEIMAD